MYSRIVNARRLQAYHRNGYIEEPAVLYQERILSVNKQLETNPQSNTPFAAKGLHLMNSIIAGCLLSTQYSYCVDTADQQVAQHC